MTGAVRYSARVDAERGWIVVDAGGKPALGCCADAGGAELAAALMNGDLAALARASPETLAQCRATLGDMLRGPRLRGRPAVGEARYPLV